MKKLFWILSGILITVSAQAQTNLTPARLAIVSEAAEAGTAADLLTTEFANNEKVQLLERNEIDKAYREQGLSARNRDDLKLGQILGADGLLALQLFSVGANQDSQPDSAEQGRRMGLQYYHNNNEAKQYLSVQLVAVRPGVVIYSERFSWPITNLTEWAFGLAKHLDSQLPKLAVLGKDAIPLSVVNFHAGVRMAAATDLERQIFLLTIERMSREKRLFVLERKRMRSLSEEKDLTSQEAEPFWNGKYLLDGAIDRDGYSPDKVTINARLIPPGGNPVLIEASGSRTNYAEVVNQLAEKVLTALQIDASTTTWEASAEAETFFKEAQWSLGCGLLTQAQVAVESAWALGKHDEECAKLRIKSYLSDIPTHLAGYNHCEHTFSPGYNADGKPLGPPPTDAAVQFDVDQMKNEHRFGLAYKFKENNSAKIIEYVFPNEGPDTDNPNRAFNALELYLNFSRVAFPNESKLYSELQDSEWYRLGIKDLTLASEVLKQFYFAPEARSSASEKLAELRALGRSVVEWISKSPSVHDSYFVGDRVATHDELAHTIEEHPNIFSFKVNWGCFWQERPEETIAVYRDLMSSPVFCYIHKNFWSRDLMQPRLTAWNSEDQKRIPFVWANFTSELATSTNLLWQMEAHALAWAGASSKVQGKNSCDNLLSLIRSNRTELVANKVELFYMNWGLDSQDSELNAMDMDYWQKTVHQTINPQPVPANTFLGTANVGSKTNPSPFEAQKVFLKANAPYDPQKFVNMFMFGFKDYSREQAQEIKPLLTEYSKHLSGTLVGMGEIEVSQIEAKVERILNPETQPLAKPINTWSPSEKLQAFDKQKEFLKANKAFDPRLFVPLFLIGFKDYSKNQAEEIKLMLAKYKKGLSGPWAGVGKAQVGQVEANVERIINPSAIVPPSSNPIAMINDNPARPSGKDFPSGRPPWFQSSEGATPLDHSGFPPNHHKGPAPMNRPNFSLNLQSESAAETDTPAPEPMVSSNIITVKDFYPLPLDALPDKDTSELNFTGQQMVEGQLVLDFEVMSVYAFKSSYAGVALFNPLTKHWLVVILPDPLTLPNHNIYQHHSTIRQGALYSSNGGKVQKFDLQKNKWVANDLAMLGNCQLYNLDGKFYAADYNTIQQITDDGRGTKLLASIQRQPPVSSLDSQGALMNLTLFMDAQKNLCTTVHNKIFRWDGNDWHEIGAAATSFMPAVFDAGVIFPTDGFNLRPARISRFEMQSNSVVLCLSQTAQEPGQRGYEPRRTDANNAPKPLWKLPAELSLPNFSAAVWQSDLYLMADHSEKKDIVNEQEHLIIGTEFHPKGGYNASLFCFSRDLPAALKVRLKFEASDGCPPMAGSESKPNFVIPGFAIPGNKNNQPWMQFTTNLLLCGRYAAPANFKPGIWVASLDLIASEANALKKTQSEAVSQQKLKVDQAAKALQAKDQQARQGFLQKYDRNHNGIIDGEERDAAQDDPYYIQYRLEEIHAKSAHDNKPVKGITPLNRQTN